MSTWDPDKLTETIIDVHRELGPGLLESAYRQCLCHELALRKVQFKFEVDVPVRYKGVLLDCGYRLDLLVEDLVIVEIKTVERLIPVHDAQLLTYLRLYKRPIGLLMKFQTPVLKDGLKRIVNNFHDREPRTSN